MTWWAAGNARQQMGPQAREAQRPDRRVLGTSRAGVGPAPSAGIVFANVVIVRGPTGAPVGVFVYATGTTPGPGNPPIASITNQSTDPFGNAVIAGITEYVTISGTKWAVTLAQSVAAFGGTLAGLAIDNLSVPWSVPASVASLETGGGANLELSSGLQTAGGQQSAIILRDSVAGGSTGGLIVTNAGVFTIQTPVTGLGLNVGAQVLNDANGVAQCRLQYGVLNEQSTTPPVSTLGPAVFGDSAAGMLRFISDSTHGDSNNYATGRQSKHITADQLINSTSTVIVGASSTPLSFAMAANVSYRFHAVIYWTQGATTATQAFRLIGTGGLALGNMRVRVYQAIQSSTGESVFEDVLSTLNSDTSLAPPSPDGITAEFDGVITPNVSGTLNLEARCVTSNADTYTIRSWSFAEIMPE